jgi:hypothetical protein
VTGKRIWTRKAAAALRLAALALAWALQTDWLTLWLLNDGETSYALPTGHSFLFAREFK